MTTHYQVRTEQGTIIAGNAGEYIHDFNDAALELNDHMPARLWRCWDGELRVDVTSNAISHLWLNGHIDPEDME